MGLRFGAARAVGAVATWVLKDLLRRPAANFPGKIGLYLDAQLISDLRPRIREHSIVVVGTNGKTTVTNLLADALEAAGKTVICNRTGANLDSGIATALLQTESADWGIFESDELWLSKVALQLQPDYVVLLNLFRDQLDRAGEIDRVQSAIEEALVSSPDSLLIYNADDPFCQAIASIVGNRCIPFGIGEDLGLPQNTVADASMCQQCDSLLEYGWRQYGQLGDYCCPKCGFSRENPVYSAVDVELSPGGSAFTVRHASFEARTTIQLPGAYMLYNALAVLAAADSCGVPFECAEAALHSFAPQNGRLQYYEIGSRRILLNLAKNPIGFNQNLRIVQADSGPKAVAFFVNDKEADGHDVSWLWDIDFQELANANDIIVFAGGERRCDVQVRLKYAGVEAQLVDGAEDFISKARAVYPDAGFYLIANYTALPIVKSELDVMDALPVPRHSCEAAVGSRGADLAGDVSAASGGASLAGEKLTIAHLYPELLNLYGDGGNVAVLADRARRRGAEVEVRQIHFGDAADLSGVDIVFLGGGPDREQRLASRVLNEHARELRNYVEDDGVLLAICGGYQILGSEWILGDESLPGLGIVDIRTGRAEGGSRNRLVGNIVLKSALANMPVVGYENHAGRTYLGSGCKPFGTVMGGCGKGNNDRDKADGVLYRNVVGTYLHGPLLAKNPEVADCLIERALGRRAAKENRPVPSLAPLNDQVEHAANTFMVDRLGARR